MEQYARDHVVGITGLFSAVALALVFSATLGAIPETVLPPASETLFAAIPHLNAGLSLLAIGTIVVGWRAIRRGELDRHRRMMLATTGLFAGFLVLYLYRVAHLGPAPFPGPSSVETYVYLPTLAIHVLLAVVTVPLVIYVLLLAVTHPVAALPETNHPSVGRVAAALWLVSFTLGVVVYLLLHVVY